ncbi:unnamed protein product [Coffea canephora]|uniref:Uncharacterized protein n=1 Tax=Coffea canephora TaxID=49390 RepID=A0A068U0N1_COFCA|nr:unnamed protein product [Coffea canephora]
MRSLEMRVSIVSKLDADSKQQQTTRFDCRANPPNSPTFLTNSCLVLHFKNKTYALFGYFIFSNK